MNIGLYIPPELFSLNLKPLELLIAAEILQFGDGKCHARASHFSKRFGRPKRTVLDAIERLRESQIIVEDGQVKRLAVAAANRAENDTNDTEIRAIVDKSARAEKRINCAENDMDRAENAHECAKNDTRSKVRNKTEVKKERTKKRGASAPVAENWIRLGRRFAEVRQSQTGSGFNETTVAAFSRLLSDIAESEPATEAEIESVVNWLATTAGRESWNFNIGKTSTSYNHPFKRNFNMYRARAKNGGRIPGIGTQTFQERGMAERQEDTPLTPEEQALADKLNEGIDF